MAKNISFVLQLLGHLLLHQNQTLMSMLEWLTKDLLSKCGTVESGTDLCFIHELLGHNSSKTTGIYTHVRTNNLQPLLMIYRITIPNCRIMGAH